MIKNFSFFANWRKKDVEYLNSLGLSNIIEIGYFGFSITEGKVFEEITSYFSKKDILSKRRPDDYSCTLTHVTFSKKELSDAENFELRFTGESKGFPQPEYGFEKQIFKYSCESCKSGAVQIAPFKIDKIKWKKNQINFTLRDPDYMFFKKDFFLEVLKPLGLEYNGVIENKTGKVSDEIVQLNIPISKSKLLIQNTVYDKFDTFDECNIKQYSVQTLDFFPPFEKDFNFLICKTQEEFTGGRKRIIISKKFCEILLKYNIINLESNHLTPMKKI